MEPIEDKDDERRIAHLKNCQEIIMRAPFDDLCMWTQRLLGHAYSAETLKPMLYDNQVIRGKLWIGDIDDADPARLEKRQIKAVVSLVEKPKQLRATESSISYYRLFIQDDPAHDLFFHFESATDFIHAQLTHGNRVLVHCMAGISRSPTLVMAYLMRFMHMNHLQAYMAVASVRPTICPNFGFFAQLRLYEAELMKK